jgi:hypothetical protein
VKCILDLQYIKWREAPRESTVAVGTSVSTAVARHAREYLGEREPLHHHRIHVAPLLALPKRIVRIGFVIECACLLLVKHLQTIQHWCHMLQHW